MPGKPKREYVAPPRDMIEKYARAVCRELKKKQGEHWAHEAHINAFSQFVKSVIEIERKHRNRQENSNE